MCSSHDTADEPSGFAFPWNASRYPKPHEVATANHCSLTHRNEWHRPVRPLLRAIPLSGKGVTGACSAAHFGEHFVSECQAGPRGAAVDPAAGKPAPVAGTRSRQKNGPGPLLDAMHSMQERNGAAPDFLHSGTSRPGAPMDAKSLVPSGTQRRSVTTPARPQNSSTSPNTWV